MRIKSNHGGFTLIEVLVVLAIIGLLVALIFPAVQSAREAARRVQCAAQIKSIGLAISQHVESRGTFPVGYGKPYDSSYIVHILPYVEQQNLFNSINLSNWVAMSVECTENNTAFQSTLSSFLCPSDSNRSSLLSLVAPNYACNAGFDALRGDGVFIGQTTRPADVTDGLSQTAGVAEWVVGSGDFNNGNFSGVTRLGPVYNISVPLPADQVDKFAELCGLLAPNVVTPSPPGYKGLFWVAGGLGRTQYNHTLPPNYPSCSNGLITSISSGSLHEGGANLLTLDGAVRFVKSSIDVRTWRSLGTRAGADLVGSY